MAALAAAWRLTEPGWHDRFESVTVYQRGHRLGGKAASSRGVHGRIEEHGLHVWLGSYENAFALLRECYAELDRPNDDAAAPIKTWDQAMIASDELGIADRVGEQWQLWPGRFTRNHEVPGEPDATGRELTVVGFIQRALELVLDFAESLAETTDTSLLLATSPELGGTHWADGVRRGLLDALAKFTDPATPQPIRMESIGDALATIAEALDYEPRPERRRLWLLLSLLTATVRGLIADDLVADPRGFRALNDEEYGAWITRHGAHPDVLDFPLVRGMYDMVFGYVEGDFEKPSFAAGLAVLFTGVALFQYKGSFFWKMTAGMGDVVIAPLYQVLQRRGVRFEFFHRVDALHLDDRHQAIDAITLGRQVWLREGRSYYDPLTRVGGLPVFPAAPMADQLADDAQTTGLESHFGPRADVETRVLRRGIDFDHVVLATSIGMVGLVAAELIDDNPDWTAMTTHVSTVATQAFQLWLRPREDELGWDRPGVTTSGYVAPFDTWASMSQTLWAEGWPDADRPETVAYFCGAFDAEWPTSQPNYAEACRQRVIARGLEYLDRHVGLYLPGAVTEAGFDWDVLCGADGLRGAAALDTQHVSVNVDPSDRYVLSVPGSDKYRLRPDESGYDNLVLAGDWTDCGMNAGCIEAAVMSGLQAANALLGRARSHRIKGYFIP
jgi:uncharacterized protein with NAD-binding domain and iron-sulfur cluster